MKKILVIDDDQFNRLFAREALEGVGYAVADAEDGESGLDKAKAESPDLILLDIVMPGLDGIEVCRRLKGIEGIGKTPVVMYTSLDENKLIEVAFEAGAADYIIKPPNVAQLRARVAMNLRFREEIARREECERKLAEALREIDRLRSGGEIIDLMK